MTQPQTSMSAQLFAGTGSCACLSVQFELLLETSVALCHCAICRRASGSALQGWVNGLRTTLKSTGETSAWRSSSHATRHFCPRCGSALFLFEDGEPDIVEVAVGALDDQAQILSRRVGYREQRPLWFPDAL